jgi:SRSO17 transposase
MEIVSFSSNSVSNYKLKDTEKYATIPAVFVEMVLVRINGRVNKNTQLTDTTYSTSLDNETRFTNFSRLQ